MVNIFLFVLFLLSIIYCCDLPLLLNLPMLICDKQSVLYDIAIGIISAYIFYFIQIFLPKLVNKLKYKKFILYKLNKIKEYMNKTVAIISGNTNFFVDEKGIDIIPKIETYLKITNIFEKRTREYKDGIELVIVDAILDLEDKIHSEIMEIISLNILDEKTFDAVLQIEKLTLRDYIRPLSVNKEGKVGKGYLIYNKEVINRGIVDIMKKYIKILETFSKFKSAQKRKIF